MDPEKELILLVRLYHAPLRKGGLLKSQVAWCKKDFERYLGYGERNKPFRLWLDKLIEIGVLYVSGFEVRNGRSVKVYLIDEDKLSRMINSNENYEIFWKMFQDKTLLGLPLDK